MRTVKIIKALHSDPVFLKMWYSWNFRCGLLHAPTWRLPLSNSCSVLNNKVSALHSVFWSIPMKLFLNLMTTVHILSYTSHTDLEWKFKFKYYWPHKINLTWDGETSALLLNSQMYPWALIGHWVTILASDWPVYSIHSGLSWTLNDTKCSSPA